VTPQPLRDYIYDRNVNEYGDPLGPKFNRVLNSAKKRLAKKLGLNEGDVPLKDVYKYITEGASRPNSDINKVMGDFNKWLSKKPDDYILKFGGG